MINGKKVIALIPARGGSKSVPKKNITLLGNKPLIAWSIDVAKASNFIDEIIVSTDCSEIANVATKLGARVQVRPNELAGDTSLVIDTIRYVISSMSRELKEEDYLLLLEPTCPLRSVQDVEGCIKMIESKDLDSVATFKEADLNPHRAWKIESDEPINFIDGVIPWLPRQKLPQAYQLNGAVYITKVGAINEETLGLVVGKSGAIIMPKDRSIDIDDLTDFIIAETLLKKRIEKEGH
ncbi:acylneuraminate cytidylyltransferase family protein [Metasolibacillus sp. FSL H7-0170]|uniref:acylneuraminate cytidylyltransferase family protein n=1 Tax=Metasolibacillus sp. FSL H7-0170 TaxID=2921431 RepID=UPI00315829B2